MAYIEVFDKKKQKKIKIYYEIAGNLEFNNENQDSKNIILLLHGWLCNNKFWNELKDCFLFEKRYTLILPDLRGHGQSDYAKDVRIEELAEDMNLLLEQLNIKKCIVFGHSMGGLIAQAFYHKYPKKVIALGLFNTGGKIPFGYGIRTLFYVIRIVSFILMLILSFPITPLFKFILAQGWKLSFYKKGKSKAYKRLIPYVKSMNKKSVLKAAFSLPKFNGIHKLAEIRVPTLILQGEKDRYITIIQFANKMAQLIPNNTFEIIPQSAHFSLNENPEYVCKTIKKFFKTHFLDE
ncbi:MAG: alpha/beta fold hydrolase [Promethearchaeota archaeon]